MKICKHLSKSSFAKCNGQNEIVQKNIKDSSLKHAKLVHIHFDMFQYLIFQC